MRLMTFVLGSCEVNDLWPLYHVDVVANQSPLHQAILRSESTAGYLMSSMTFVCGLMFRSPGE